MPMLVYWRVYRGFTMCLTLKIEVSELEFHLPRRFEFPPFGILWFHAVLTWPMANLLNFLGLHI